MMYKEYEILALMLSLGVLITLLIFIRLLSRLPKWKLLLSSYLFMVCAAIATVLEGFYLPVVLNHIEHLATLVGLVLLGLWTWNVFMRGRQKQ